MVPEAKVGDKVPVERDSPERVATFDPALVTVIV